MSQINSAGTNVNRYLDSLGMPDAFGDAIGALVDARRGDFGGAARNLVDLQSGLPTSALDSMIKQAGRSFGRGHVARHRWQGPHLANHGSSYAGRHVGRKSHVGQRYNFNIGPFQCQGRVTNRQYGGSFSKPIQLNDNQWLFHGRTYNSLKDVFSDIRDGRIDGNAGRVPNFPHFPSFPNPGDIAQANPFGPFNPSQIAQDILNSIFGGQQPGGANGTNGTNGNGGASPSPATTDTGADGASDIMNGPGSLEDKLLLLMDKLAKFMDNQIEEQMKKIESEMAKQKQGGQGGAQGGSGLGGMLGPLGGIAGGAIGGPLGGMAGSALGNALGGASNGGSNGTSGSGNDSDKSNLQLLQSQLQQMIERRNQMFQTMTQMLKSLNDTSLAIIRNLKA